MKNVNKFCLSLRKLIDFILQIYRIPSCCSNISLPGSNEGSKCPADTIYTSTLSVTNTNAQTIETLTRERSRYELSVHILETIFVQHIAVYRILCYILLVIFIPKYLHYTATELKKP